MSGDSFGRLLLAGVLLYSTLSGAHGRSVTAADELLLVVPAQRGSIPRLQGTRVLLKSPTPARQTGTAKLASFKDEVFVAWSKVAEKPPHSTTTWLASSNNGAAWSEAHELGAETNEAYLTYWLRESGQERRKRAYQLLLEPRTFHVANDRLYLWTRATVNGAGRGRIFSTADGKSWSEFPPYELDRLEREPALRIRNVASNRGFAELDDGRLLAACLGETGALGQFCAPLTRESKGLAGWEDGWIDTSAAERLTTPNVWRAADGTLHFVAHDGTSLWHSFSRDRGGSWSRLRAANHFRTDATQRKYTRLPDGRVLFVGDVDSKPLLAVSRDGWRFARPRRLPTELKCSSSAPSVEVHDGRWIVVRTCPTGGVEVVVIDAEPDPSDRD